MVLAASWYSHTGMWTRSVHPLGFSTVVSNLGILFDEQLSMADHVTAVCKSCFFQLRLLRLIRSCLTMDSAKTLVHAFISSRLDYCNSLLVGAADCIIRKLQVQNAAARLIAGTRKFDHITQILWDLHWLPVHQRIIIQDHDAGQQVSAGTSSPVSDWALPTSGWVCWMLASEVGCLQQTECAMDSHNHRSQELCCFRTIHLVQPTNRPASFVTVGGNFCTTPEGTFCSAALNDMPVARLSFLRMHYL